MNVFLSCCQMAIQKIQNLNFIKSRGGGLSWFSLQAMSIPWVDLEASREAIYRSGAHRTKSEGSLDI